MLVPFLKNSWGDLFQGIAVAWTPAAFVLRINHLLPTDLESSSHLYPLIDVLSDVQAPTGKGFEHFFFEFGLFVRLCTYFLFVWDAILFGRHLMLHLKSVFFFCERCFDLICLNVSESTWDRLEWCKWSNMVSNQHFSTTKPTFWSSQPHSWPKKTRTRKPNPNRMRSQLNHVKNEVTLWSCEDLWL